MSAPHWPSQGPGSGGESHLNSPSPFSLLNALRVALARTCNPDSAWSLSNWRSAANRKQTIFISDYLGESLAWLDRAIESERPNLVLIGSMTLSLPGAIAIAERVRAACPQALIVYGGKHANETCHVDAGGTHLHPGSPLVLMARGQMAPVFDLVVSGDGEELTAQLGEVWGRALGRGAGRAEVLSEEGQKVLRRAKGRWDLFWLEGDCPRALSSCREEIDYGSVPCAYAYFPVESRFAVLERDLTAHVTSDTSNGCIYSCFFCSEAASINGKPVQLESAGVRLANRLEALCERGRAAGKSMSAFVEDSVLLQGSASALEDLADTLISRSVDIRFGAQLTVDSILRKNMSGVLQKLRAAGMSYVFVGLETGEDTLAQRMHKNVSGNGRKRRALQQVDWTTKAEMVFTMLGKMGVAAGVSVLFGLGESQADRLRLLQRIRAWQRCLGQPRVVSLNWAVKHPLRQWTDPQAQTYMEWGMASDDPRLPVVARIFGEASARYCLDGVELAPLAELLEVERSYRQLTNQI